MSFKKAFTMIELIFVIVIIGILAAIAVPKLEKAKHKVDNIEIEKFIEEAQSTINTFATRVANQTSPDKEEKDTSFDDTVRVEE